MRRDRCRQVVITAALLLTAESGALWAAPAAGYDSLKRVGIDPSALGDPSAQLVYTAVAPCRILDTRVAGGSLAVGVPRDFRVTALDLSPQGGSSTGCVVPFRRATVALINLVAVTPAGPGNLRAWAYHTPAADPPHSSVLNYTFVPGARLNIANAVAIPICDATLAGQTCPLDFRVQADGNGTHLVADVVGYFERFPTEQVSGLVVPTGALILWNASNQCPAGYTREATLDERFLRAAAVPGVGGTENHAHDISHAHGMDHVHSGTTSVNTMLERSGLIGSATSAARGPHSHTFTTGGAVPDLTAEPTDQSTTASSLPPYHEILFCRKAAPAAPPSGVAPGRLGDSNAQLLYTPVTPCRILDTRAAGGSMQPWVPRDFQVTGTDLSPQGGNASGCHVPFGRATAAYVNLVAVAPTGPGNLRAWAYRSPPAAPPPASVLNYALIPSSPLNIANAIAIPVCDPAEEGQPCTLDMRIQADGSATHVVADVVGFFERFPSEEVASLGLPDGAIMAWRQSSSCPAGYARVANMDNRFPRGAPAVGQQGGTEIHHHGIGHSHSMAHTHGGTTNASSGAVRVEDLGPGGTGPGHTHSFSTGGPSDDVTGEANVTASGSAAHVPPYSDVLFCQKVASGHPPSAPRALGDAKAQLVYTPVSPCRILDTRNTGQPLAIATPRDFRVTGRDLTAQGGSLEGCNVPRGRATIAFINFVAAVPLGPGNLRAWASRTPPSAPPPSSVLNYAFIAGSRLNIANAIPVEICDATESGQPCSSDIRVQADGSGTHLVADVVGFWERFPTEEAPGLAIPSGTIMIWDRSGQCPTGYSREGGLDGRFLRSAPQAGGTGGEEQHAHGMPAHQHWLKDHTHSGTTSASDEWSCCGTAALQAARSPHTHTFTTGGPSTSLTAQSETATTGPAPNLPPYADVVLCRKD